MNRCKLPKVGKIKENEEDRPKSTKSLLQNPFWEVGSEVANAHGWNLSRILHFLCFSIVLVRSLIANKQHSIRPKKKKFLERERHACINKFTHTYIPKKEKLKERENLEQRLCLTRKGWVDVEREGEGERRSIVTFWKFFFWCLY